MGKRILLLLAMTAMLAIITVATADLLFAAGNGVGNGTDGCKDAHLANGKYTVKVGGILNWIH
jgi:hypothetical protein